MGPAAVEAKVAAAPAATATAVFWPGICCVDLKFSGIWDFGIDGKKGCCYTGKAVVLLKFGGVGI